MTALVQIALGSVLLLAGRRLYWLLAGAAGFVLGMFLTQQLFSDASQTVLLFASLALGVLFAVLAVVGQRFIIGLVGFMAGGIGLSWLFTAFNFTPAEPSTLLTFVIFIAGGIAGAFLLSRLFDLGLVLLSSLLGAELALRGLGQVIDLPDTLGAIPLIVLMVIGIAVQLGPMRR
ncbi:MAG: DUF4203 domain-containing protein [Anaerolineae bacterium]